MVEESIDVNMCNQFNQTPLHVALNFGICEIVKLLLNTGKILLANDYEKNNELHVWIGHHCENCLTSLKKIVKREKILEKNIKNNNVVHQSIIDNNFSALRMLIEQFEFTDFNEIGENEYNVMQLCCAYGSIVTLAIVNFV